MDDHAGKTNLLEETLQYLQHHSKSEDDIEFVTDGENHITWDCYKYFAKDIYYYAGYGSPEINGGLRIVGKDWWIERHEYDGNEHFVFKTKPLLENLHHNMFNIKNTYSYDDDEIEKDNKELLSQYEAYRIAKALEDSHPTFIEGVIKKAKDQKNNDFYIVEVPQNNKVIQQYLQGLENHMNNSGYSNYDYEEFKKNKLQNKNKYHLSVILPSELKKLNKKSNYEQLEGQQITLECTHLGEINDYDLVHKEKQVSYHVLIQSKDIQDIRKQQGLGTKTLFISLAYSHKELFNQPKDESSIVMTKLDIFEPNTTTKTFKI